MIIRAECLSLKRPSRGDVSFIFTIDDLQSIAKGCIGKYVYKNFDFNSEALGIVVDSEVVDDKLIISIETNSILNGLFCGPCFTVKSKSVVGFGVFETHAQDNVLPIGSIMTNIKKVIDTPYYKIVSYGKYHLPAHAEVKYLAIDSVGQLWGFKELPKVHDEAHSWVSNDDWKTLIAIVEFEGNWKESLIRV